MSAFHWVFQLYSPKIGNRRHQICRVWFCCIPLDPQTMKNEGFEPPIYGLRVMGSYGIFYSTFLAALFFLDKSQETSSRTGVIFKFAETPKSISTTSALFTSGLSEKSYQPPTSRHWIQPKIFVDGRNPTQPPGM